MSRKNFKIAQDNFEVLQNKDNPQFVSKKEIDFYVSSQYLTSKNAFNFSPEILKIHYPSEEGLFIIKTFKSKKLEKFLGCLNYHGVLTRWKLFLSFLESKVLTSKEYRNKSCFDVFKEFANYLGRVTSYRALSLTKEQYENVRKIESIVCVGRLRASNSEIKSVYLKRGVKNVCYNRLYMMKKIDPTLSCHDDPETATCIASNFLGKDKKVYLFELNIPLIETIGLVVKDVQSNKKDWFLYDGIWFDSTKTTTERYMVNEIPLFEKRLKSVKVFKDKVEVNKFIESFRKSQLKKKKQYDLECKK